MSVHSRAVMLAAAVAAVVIGVASQTGGTVDARQQLVAPQYTIAQRDAGQALYKQNCASCHGANLDDGPFAPALRGTEFRATWFGRPAEELFLKIETMPPAAPNSLGAARHAELLAFLMAQNQLVAGDVPVSSDPAQLRSMLLPGFVGGPSGGLVGGVALPPAPTVANPL